MSHIKMKRTESPPKPPIPADLWNVVKEYAPRISVKNCKEVISYGYGDDYSEAPVLHLYRDRAQCS